MVYYATYGTALFGGNDFLTEAAQVVPVPPAMAVVSRVENILWENETYHTDIGFDRWDFLANAFVSLFATLIAGEILD